MSSIRRSAEFEVPATTLWRALTDSELLATWLMLSPLLHAVVRTLDRMERT